VFTPRNNETLLHCLSGLDTSGIILGTTSLHVHSDSPKRIQKKISLVVI
jgi:hypothetical protein